MFKSKERGKYDKPLCIFWFLLIVCVIFPIAFFIGKFSNQTISDKVGDWGSFGSFIDGIIGTIVAFANLYIIVRISKITSEIQQKIQERDFINETIKHFTKILDTFLESLHSLKREMIASQSTLGGKAKQELKCSDKTDFKNAFNFLFKRILGNSEKDGTSSNRNFKKEMLGEVLFAKLQFKSACDTSKDLFSDLCYQELIDSLDKMAETLNVATNEQYSSKAFQIAFENFVKQKDNFLKELRKNLNK